MKRILLAIVLLISTVGFSQGRLGYVSDSLYAELSYKFTAPAESFIGEDGRLTVTQMTNNGETQFIYYFDDGETPMVTMSMVHSLTNSDYLKWYDLCNRDYVRMRGDEWHNYYDWGVVIVNLYLVDGDRYPNFVFTYEIY